MNEFYLLLSYVPRIPSIGETIHGTNFETGYGGKGANQAVAASRLGSNTVLISKLGDDVWGKDYYENFKKEGISTKYIDLIENQKTGIAQINVANDGSNQIVIVVGANNLLSSKDVEYAENIFKHSKVLLCQLETPIPATITALSSFKGISILNAAPGISDIPKELLTLPTIFCVNETEAALVTGLKVQSLTEIKDAINALMSMGCSNVILTVGERGAAFASKIDPRPAIVKAQKVDKVVDTTGAGDAFLGALAHFYAKNPDIPLYKKIGAACEIASYSVKFAGTQKSFPRSDEFNFNNFENIDYDWNYL